jgi:hypothetical protein
MRISTATIALQNNLDAKDPETRAAPFFRPEAADKKPVALDVVDLSKRYGTTTAVSGLNFEIR